MSFNDLNPTRNKEYIVLIRFFFVPRKQNYYYYWLFKYTYYVWYVYKQCIGQHDFFLKLCSSKSVLASPTIKGSTDLLMLHLRGTELVEYSQLITVGFYGP